MKKVFFLPSLVALIVILITWWLSHTIRPESSGHSPPPPRPDFHQMIETKFYVSNPSQVAAILSNCSGWNLRLDQQGNLQELVVFTDTGQAAYIPGSYDPSDTTKNREQMQLVESKKHQTLTIRTRQGSLTVPYKAPTKK